MASPSIAGLRSVSLTVPDLARAETFYTGVWRLEVAHRRADALYLRGAGHDDWILSLHRPGGEQQTGEQQTGEPEVRPELLRVTLRARASADLARIAEAAVAAGGRVLSPPGALDDDPAGGYGLTVADPHGRIFQVVHGDRQRVAASDAADAPDQPLRLTHVVLNSHAVDETQAFLAGAFGFRLADRTVAIAFMNRNADHHTLAIGIGDDDALNHIAFLMPDGDAVMRGGGRLKDAGFPIAWGPGRHGPGNNLFNYFIDPFGIVIEYTAEVQQVDDHYRAGGPGDWRWPPGRVDQWGISPPPGPTLKAAQRRIRFAPVDLAEASIGGPAGT